MTSLLDEIKSLSTIELLSLRYVLLVEEHGSFRRAAVVLDVRPSVVSRRIQGLEDALGVSLFERQSQGARITSAGRQVLALGRTILDSAHELVRIAGARGAAKQGGLCIGVASSIVGGKIHRFLKAFLAAAPDVDLEVVEGSARDHLSAVRRLRMDTAFVIGSAPIQGCEIDPLWSEPIMVALSTSHPLVGQTSLTIDALADEVFAVSKADPGPEVHDYVVQRFARLDWRPRIDTSDVHREGLMALVGLGQGISLVCAAEAEVSYPDVVFRPLADETVPFSLVWSAERDNPVLRRFLSLARSQARLEARQTVGLSEASSVAPL